MSPPEVVNFSKAGDELERKVDDYLKAGRRWRKEANERVARNAYPHRQYVPSDDSDSDTDASPKKVEAQRHDGRERRHDQGLGGGKPLVVPTAKPIPRKLLDRRTSRQNLNSVGDARAPGLGHVSNSGLGPMPINAVASSKKKNKRPEVPHQEPDEEALDHVNQAINNLQQTTTNAPIEDRRFRNVTPATARSVNPKSKAAAQLPQLATVPVEGMRNHRVKSTEVPTNNPPTGQRGYHHDPNYLSPIEEGSETPVTGAKRSKTPVMGGGVQQQKIPQLLTAQSSSNTNPNVGPTRDLRRPGLKLDMGTVGKAAGENMHEVAHTHTLEQKKIRRRLVGDQNQNPNQPSGRAPGPGEQHPRGQQGQPQQQQPQNAEQQKKGRRTGPEATHGHYLGIIPPVGANGGLKPPGMPPGWSTDRRPPAPPLLHNVTTVPSVFVTPKTQFQPRPQSQPQPKQRGGGSILSRMTASLPSSKRKKMLQDQGQERADLKQHLSRQLHSYADHAAANRYPPGQSDDLVQLNLKSQYQSAMQRMGKLEERHKQDLQQLDVKKKRNMMGGGGGGGIGIWPGSKNETTPHNDGNGNKRALRSSSNRNNNGQGAPPQGQPYNYFPPPRPAKKTNKLSVASALKGLRPKTKGRR